jgi:ribonuclease P protein component
VPGARFRRAFRLKRRRLIRSLFDRSRADVITVAVGCIRLLARKVPRAETAGTVPLQVGFAPGRRLRTAVVRNRVRRILRETFRVHQHLLLRRPAKREELLVVMVLFRADPAQAARCVPQDLPEALHRLAERLGDREQQP